MFPNSAIFREDTAPLDSPAALTAHIEEALAAKPLGGWELELLYQAVKRWFKPSVSGAENIPERPCLFVGNHGLFAIDGLILLPLMLRDYTRFLRPMGDKFLFSDPRIARLLLSRGATMGHPEVCRALMGRGHDLIVFPGGAHEAVKPACENYRLQWKDRDGFVRLAAEQGYTIVPFGMVGPDDFYSHLIEGADLPDTAVGRLLTCAGLLDPDMRRDVIPPLPRGMLGTLLPRPEPCYIGFCEPIDLSGYAGRRLTQGTRATLRDRVASAINAQVDQLLQQRRQDYHGQSLLRRILTL
jgi:1-acyl-sn-glycerol-3-phosphate acyltransferase